MRVRLVLPKFTARVTNLNRKARRPLLRYDADVEIGGKLMSVGSRLIQSAAAKNLQAFFGAFAKQLEETSAATAVEAAPFAENAAADTKKQSADGFSL